MDKLKSAAGNYKGTNRLHYPPNSKPDDMPSNLMLTAILNGRFIRIDYVWSYQNAPQEGSMLIGFEPAENLVTMHWIDMAHEQQGAGTSRRRSIRWFDQCTWILSCTS